MALLHDRSGRGGVHLEWRIRLFTIGALLGLGGMIMTERWIVWVAMIVLLVAFGLRFLPVRGSGQLGRGSEGEGRGDDTPSGTPPVA